MKIEYAIRWFNYFKSQTQTHSVNNGEKSAFI